MTIEEDGQLDWEVGQHLWGSDWEDDEDFLDSQRSYSDRGHGHDADSGWRATARGAARVMATRSVAALEEATQVTETVGIATPSQTGQDVPAAKEEKFIIDGASESTATTTADEERRAARKVAYLSLVADRDARRRTRLTDMKQRLPSLATRLRK
ncbi:MAG: hypothetical protein ACK56F_30910, partial [bacterium]